MPSLQVRDLPDALYQKLRRQAATEHRSLAQEAVALLSRSLNLPEPPQARRAALLAEIKRNAPHMNQTPEPAALIREDRER